MYFLQDILNEALNIVPACLEINTIPGAGIVNKKFI